MNALPSPMLTLGAVSGELPRGEVLELEVNSDLAWRPTSPRGSSGPPRPRKETFVDNEGPVQPALRRSRVPEIRDFFKGGFMRLQN